LKAKISSFADGGDNRITTQDILVFVQDWYVTHIANEDIQLVKQTKAAVVAKLLKD
jgi:hemerythrin